MKLKDPLAAPRESQGASPHKKRRFANLAFDGDAADHQQDALLGALLQNEESTYVSRHLAASGLHLSATAPETAAVLDGLLLRALGSRACARRYLLLRFLWRLCQMFPDASVVGLDFVQAQQLGGGLPDAVALKIPPAALLCRALQPTVASPRLLICPSAEVQREPFADNCGKPAEANSSPEAEGWTLMAVLSPSMLLGGISAIGSGLLRTVLLT